MSRATDTRQEKRATRLGKQARIALHTKRLQRLLTVIQRVPLRKFDMAVWGEHRGPHVPRPRSACGTTACALGWAALDPVLRRQGLMGTWEPEKRDHDDIWAEDRGGGPGYHVLRISFGRKRMASAGAAFFGLSEDESESLFYRARDRADVVHVLRGLIAERDEMDA